jgi:hypothetical protein
MHPKKERVIIGLTVRYHHYYGGVEIIGSDIPPDIPLVGSSSFSLLPSSSPSSEDNEDDNDNDGSGPQDNSPQDDSEGTDSSSEGSGDDGNNDNNGIRQTDDQDLIDDDGDDGVEPPTSTERGGNPLDGLNLRNLEKDKADCEKYLKSLGGSDGTNIGDTIENPFETKEEFCKRILGGAGIDIRNTTMGTTSVLMNQTGLINNDNATEMVIKEEGMPSPCIVIKEEGMPSGPSRPQPQPQPSPSPKPC